MKRDVAIGSVALVIGIGIGALVVANLSPANETAIPEANASALPSPSASSSLQAPRNVIVFIGDGMGISTITAARILEGQMRGETGEENSLSFEAFPQVGLSKVYAVDSQIPDSAATITALMSGVKTNNGVLNVRSDVVRGDCLSVRGNELITWMMLAEQHGLSTGVVTTRGLTDATPAGTYAVSPERSWLNDAQIPEGCSGYPDIASQLLSFDTYGDGFEVALGGGRRDFIPTSSPEGARTDGRNLTEEWASRGAGWTYVENASDLDQIDLSSTEHLLGLFSYGDMQFEYDRTAGAVDEPSLSEMTELAIDQLSSNASGYTLLIESGNIDTAHHATNAFRALTETIELSNAVRAAIARVDMSETLIVVTADHGQSLTISGYSSRGNPILGVSDQRTDSVGHPFTTLGYATGPNVSCLSGIGCPPSLAGIDTQSPDYHQQARVPMESATHSGVDVAVFARGPGSEEIGGVREQNYYGAAIMAALGFDNPNRQDP